MQGINIVGLQFRKAGKIYDFSYQSLDIKIGDSVVVESEKGPAIAEIVTLSYENSDVKR